MLTRYDIVEEVEDSSPREWRVLSRDETALQAVKTLRALRNMSPLARLARREAYEAEKEQGVCDRFGYRYFTSLDLNRGLRQ